MAVLVLTPRFWVGAWLAARWLMPITALWLVMTARRNRLVSTTVRGGTGNDTIFILAHCFRCSSSSSAFAGDGTDSLTALVAVSPSTAVPALIPPLMELILQHHEPV